MNGYVCPGTPFDPRILGRRTLERDQRKLAVLLRPGMTVLDIGCGTGAITAGIAAAVGASGMVTGVDRNEGLLAIARETHTAANLRFACGNATRLDTVAEFDCVTTARTLQWISDPAAAVMRMKRAAKPGGLVVALDYSHERNAWLPAPPPEFQTVYRAFLQWRAAHGWDNRIADHLADLFRAAGLAEVTAEAQDEVATRGEPGFAEAAGLWLEVMENLGGVMVGEGFCAEGQLASAQAAYAAFLADGLERQTLAMVAATGMA